jgi:branched-chain amino acid transport system substrate-binding protein
MRLRVCHTGSAVALAAIAAGVVIAGCGSAAGSKTTTTSLIQKHQPKQLYVYASLPHSGPQAGQAASVLNGIRLALDQADKQAGPYRLVLKSLDDGGPAPRGWTASATARNARRAAIRPDTVLYIGELDSGASAVSIPILNQALIPQISPGSPATYLTTDGTRFRPAGAATFLRLVPDDAQAARANLRALRKLGCAHTVVVDDSSGRDLVSAMRSAASEFMVKLGTIGKTPAAPLTPAAIARYVRRAQERGECVFYSGVATPQALTLTHSLQSALPPTAAVVGSSQLCDAGWARAVAPPPPASSDAGKLGTGTAPSTSTSPTATTTAVTATSSTDTGTVTSTTAGTTATRTIAAGTTTSNTTTSTTTGSKSTAANTTAASTTPSGTLTSPGQGTVSSASLWCTTPTPDLSASELGRAFIQAYRRQFQGHRPDLPAIFGYEAMEVGMQAINTLGARADNREALLNELHNMTVIDSALGTQSAQCPTTSRCFAFDEPGESTLASYSLYSVRAGGGLSYNSSFSTGPAPHSDQG